MTDATTAYGAVTSRTTRELLACRAPLHASLSPDAQTLVVTSAFVPQGTEEEQAETCLVDVGSGRTQAVPGAEPGDRLMQWSPDGTALAFVGDSDGTTCLGVLRPSTGERRPLDARHVDGLPVWSPDGTMLVVACRRGTTVDRARPYRWSRPYPAADGLGPLEDPPQLRLVDVETGAGRWLTDDDWRWSMPRWAPSGDRVAAGAGGDPEDRIGGQVLRVVSLDGTVDQPEVPGGRAVVPCWLADDSLLVLVPEPHGPPSGSATQLFHVTGEGTRRIDVDHLLGDVFGDCAAELADTYEHVLLAQGHTVLVRTGGRGRLGISRVDVGTGLVDQVVGGDRACSPVAWVANRLVMTVQTPEAYPQLATIDLAAGPSSEQVLVSPAAHVARTVEVERFVVESAEGFELDAWFLAPTGAVRPLPTVLVVHGGPHFTYGEAFSLDAQALCAAGFGVLYTNPRGSTGFGDVFAHAVHGDWAEGPSRDVLTVVDAAVARRLADPDRLGITGNSYGGYLSAWLASTTDRFAAAVVENPVTDLIGMYGTSDIGRRFFPAQLGGAPHEVLDVYTSQSPLLQAHRCRTPCLFVTGELDRRCPPAQAWAMHRVLCDVGTPSEVLVLPGSSHEGSTYGPPAARIAHDDALVEWMTRWLRP